MQDLQRTLLKYGLSRRGFLAGAGTVAAVAATGCGGSGATFQTPTTPTAPAAPTLTDVDILNFALNLEYLEANFYLVGATGQGLPTSLQGSSPGAITANGAGQVNFGSSFLQELANEIAQQELQHVQAIQATITSLGGTPISQPAIDYNAGLAALVTASGLPSFNAFADAQSFFVAAGVFEDLGVSAYTGAAHLIQSATVLDAAAGIQAAEAYHGGLIRTIIAGTAATSGNTTYRIDFGSFQQVKSKLGGGMESVLFEGSVDAKGNVTPSTLVNADSNGLTYARTPDEVMHIAYATQPGDYTGKGGFFPAGLNGTVKQPTT